MAAPMRIGALLGKYVLRPGVTRPYAALTTDAGGSKATTAPPQGAKAPPPPPPKAADPVPSKANEDKRERRLKSKNEETTAAGTPTSNHVASQWTVSVLKQLLKQKGIKYKASARKADLLTLLRDSEANDGSILSEIETTSDKNMSSQTSSPQNSLDLKPSENMRQNHQTVSELRQLLRERGIKFKTADRKAKLVELLVKAQSVDTHNQDTVQAATKETEPQRDRFQRKAEEDGDTTEKPVAAGPEYKAAEYYSYNPMSFYDVDASCDAHRLPQPSNKK